MEKIDTKVTKLDFAASEPLSPEDRNFLGSVDPEKRLMAAVLMDAIKTFLKYRGSKDPRESVVYQETREWLFGEEDHDWLYSFPNICLTLNLDVDRVREKLQAIARRARRKRAEQVGLKDLVEETVL